MFVPRPLRRLAALAVVSSACCLARPAAQVALPAVFGDHMVLQRDAAVPVWGVAPVGARVTVSLGEHAAVAEAGADGTFRVTLGPLRAGGPHRLVVRAGEASLELRDVLVGEVWVCSGQSNMEWPVRRAANAEAEIAAADLPAVRLFKVARQVSAERPADDVRGSWQRCSPETVADFSAVGYAFGRALRREVDVPIGLIQSAWGGTPAEAWTRRATLDRLPVMAPTLRRWEQTLADYPARQAQWEQAARAAREAGRRPPGRPRGPQHPHVPGGLFNGMLAPIVGFGIRGAIWYQGESNASRAYQYRTLFPAMIEDWRDAWGQGDFPFLFVQLASFKVRVPATWAELREAQLMALRLPNTGMAVTTDIGNPRDIHPRNKREVGERLARWALWDVYQRDVVASGPLFRRVEIEPGAVRLHFAHRGGGLAARGGGPLAGFEVASVHGAFYPAEARIDGQAVVVRSDAVAWPALVRYAWTDCPMDANLVNVEGLPASPFRSDDRPCVTESAR